MDVIIKDFAHNNDPLVRGVRLNNKLVNLKTQEGNVPVKELIAVLTNQKPLQPLEFDEKMKAIACRHVEDVGPIGGVGHTSTTG